MTRRKKQPVDPWIQKYIFPGGHIPSVREIISLFPDYELYLQDVESLRLHYAKTLDSWASRFEKHVPGIEQMHDERFVKMWRLYLQSSAAFFRLGGLDIHQFVFTKGVNNELECTRKHIYK
ncbi:class I SAM-dependent methyltransferase [Alkalicoccus halolimnae]|uniref:Class I SAM-dependent methyltransferase n=1 Tax=Alkalicoccus halolimnae TaxID=1667239 RepID=A0AAJ8LUH7_9BACI|nr:class I SAM-dependent methyltransferase [Alkalicoccus halolimnae]